MSNIELPFPSGGGSLFLSQATERVHEFLGGHFDSPITDVSLLGVGEWSQAFAFRSGAHEYVIRISRFEEDFAKDRLAAGFTSSRLPIPRVVEIGEAFDGFYAVSERVFGAPLDGLGHASMRHLLPSLLEPRNPRCHPERGRFHVHGIRPVGR